MVESRRRDRAQPRRAPRGCAIEGFITEAEQREAIQTTIRVRPYPGASDPRGGYAKEYLRQQFRDQFGGDHPPDWEVRTTFVPELQEAAEQAVANGLRAVQRRDLQAALVAIDPRTGDILAMVGGRDFRQSQFNRASRSRRQPGSAFKPLLYAAALEHGYSPVTVVDGLATIAPQGPDEWSPRNADGDMPDALTLRAALLESNNRAATLLQQQVGSRPVLSLASDAGLRDMPDVPSLSLGTGLVTPLDLTAAFAMFPNGGLAVPPRAIVRVVNADGGIALDNPVQTERVISPQTAFQMVSMLDDVIDRGTGASVRRAGLSFPAGGKTGTTNDFKDAWFVGFSPTLVVGVWVGFDQPKTIGREGYGSRYALPIWSEFMRRASRIRGARHVRRTRRIETGVALSRLVSEAGGRLPDLHRVSETARRRAWPALHPPSGHRQAAGPPRGEGFLSGLGKKIRGIFR